MKLYIVRHGQTDWNKDKRVQGRSEVPLNEYGVYLARETAKGLADVRFDYVFSSPLGRAIETARILLEGKEKEIVTDDRLIEIGFGEDEGVPANKRREDFMNFFKDPVNYVPAPGGESYEELCARTGNFIEKVIVPLSLKEPDATVLISGHGAMNRSLMLYLRHQGIEDMWSGPFQKNCCVNLFDIEGEKFTLLEEARIYYTEEE